MEWLNDQIEREGFVLGLHQLFVRTYDRGQIKKLITKFVENRTGDSWRELANKISRIARWEFLRLQHVPGSRLRACPRV